MSLLLAWALCYAGFTALCITSERHHAAFWAGTPSRRAVLPLRALGFALLAGALAICAAPSPASASAGIVAWFGILTATAVPLAFALPYAPRLVVRTAFASPVLALALTQV